MKKYLIIVLLLAGCQQPMSYSPELDAKVIALWLVMTGGPSAGWAEGMTVAGRPCGQAFHEGVTESDYWQSKSTCRLREFSVPDGGFLRLRHNITGLTSPEMWENFEIDHTPVFPAFYPFNVKARYGGLMVSERGGDDRLGPFFANRCYVVWAEPTPVEPYRENDGRGTWVTHELKQKFKETECGIAEDFSRLQNYEL